MGLVNVPAGCIRESELKFFLGSKEVGVPCF